MQFQLKNGQMFDTDYPACPVCGGEMFDNRNSKKSPSHPDFRCKNQDCKDEKGFRTGVYLPKPKGQAPAAAPAKPVPAAKPASAAPAAGPKPAPAAATPAPARPVGGKGDYGNSVPPSMYGAWAMNLVVALVGQGKVTNVAEGVAAYKEALKGVGEAIDLQKIALDAKLPATERQVPPPATAKPAPAAAPASSTKPVTSAPKPVAPAPAAAPAEDTATPQVESPEQIPDPIDAITQELGGEGMGEISMDDLSNVDI